MPLTNTELGENYKKGTFQLPDAKEILIELRELIQHIDCDPVQFMANHASNYLPLSGRFGRDKPDMLESIKQALAGNKSLVQEQYRAL